MLTETYSTTGTLIRINETDNRLMEHDRIHAASKTDSTTPAQPMCVYNYQVGLRLLNVDTGDRSDGLTGRVQRRSAAATAGEAAQYVPAVAVCRRPAPVRRTTAGRSCSSDDCRCSPAHRHDTPSHTADIKSATHLCDAVDNSNNNNISIG